MHGDGVLPARAQQSMHAARANVSHAVGDWILQLKVLKMFNSAITSKGNQSME